MKITEADRFTDEAKIEEYKKRYGREEYERALSQVNDNIGKSLLSLYKINSSLTEVLFIERCLNLLKPGGRMGIVLPEGVLNTDSLQKARDFVEGKAKILLIVSIPQDVFIASGATVKPSLLFFKKFTEEETFEYSHILHQAQMTISAKYENEVRELEEKLQLKGKDALTKDEKKTCRKKLKVITEKIEIEVKKIAKEKFDYEIPIAEIQKAGISSTGAEIDNELIPLAKEFTPYRVENKLWSVPIKSVKYRIDEDGNTFRFRMTDNIVSEPEPVYMIKK